MKEDATIVVTGAAGFIGSCLVGFLDEQGFKNLLLVDDFGRADKIPNLEGKQFRNKIEREEFFKWLHIQEPHHAASYKSCCAGDYYRCIFFHQTSSCCPSIFSIAVSYFSFQELILPQYIPSTSTEAGVTTPSSSYG